MNTNFQQEKHDNRFMLYFLSNTPSIGAVSAMKLCNQYNDLNVLLDLDADDLQASGILYPGQIKELIENRKNTDLLFKEYCYMTNSNIRFITYYDELYPDRLRNISSPPVVLYVKGDLPEPEAPSVAIVGSRSSTGYGISIASYLGEFLADEGINIISGMARGIDGAAQRGALKSQP